MRTSPLLSLGLLAVSAAGCATTKAYFGPDLPREKLAIVKPNTLAALNPVHWGARSVALKVNGVKQGFWSNKVAVAPGHVEVDATVRRTGFGRKLESQNLNFSAEAGHEYIVKGQIEGVWIFGIGGVPRVWIKDTTSGEIVAGDPPEGVKTPRQEHGSIVVTRSPPTDRDKTERSPESPKREKPRTASSSEGVDPESLDDLGGWSDW